MNLKIGIHQYEKELSFLNTQQLLKEQDENESVIKNEKVFFKRRIAEKRRTSIANRMWELKHGKKY